MNERATRARNFAVSIACAAVTIVIGSLLLRAHENRVQTPTGYVERQLETLGVLMNDQKNSSVSDLRDYFSVYVSLHVYVGVFGSVLFDSVHYSLVPPLSCAMYAVVSALLMVNSDWSSALVLAPASRISVSAWDPSLLFTPSVAMLAVSTHIFCRDTQRRWEVLFYSAHFAVYIAVLLILRQATIVSVCTGLSLMGVCVSCVHWCLYGVPKRVESAVEETAFSIEDEDPRDARHNMDDEVADMLHVDPAVMDMSRTDDEATPPVTPRGHPLDPHPDMSHRDDDATPRNRPAPEPPARHEQHLDDAQKQEIQGLVDEADEEMP